MQKRIESILKQTNFIPEGQNSDVVRALAQELHTVVEEYRQLDEQFHHGLQVGLTPTIYDFLCKLTTVNQEWVVAKRIFKTVIVKFGTHPESFFENYMDLYETLYTAEKNKRMKGRHSETLLHLLIWLKERIIDLRFVETRYLNAINNNNNNNTSVDLPSSSFSDRSGFLPPLVKAHSDEMISIPTTDLLFVMAKQKEYQPVLEKIDKFLVTGSFEELAPLIRMIPPLLEYAVRDVGLSRSSVGQDTKYRQWIAMEDRVFSAEGLIHLLCYDSDGFHPDDTFKFSRFILEMFGSHERFMVHLQSRSKEGVYKGKIWPLIMCYAYGHGVNNVGKLTQAFRSVYGNAEQLKTALEIINSSLFYILWGYYSNSCSDNKITLTALKSKISDMSDVIFGTDEKTNRPLVTIEDVLAGMQYDMAVLCEKVKQSPKLDKTQMDMKIYSLFTGKDGDGIKKVEEIVYDMVCYMLIAKSNEKTEREILSLFYDITQKMPDHKQAIMALLETLDRVYPVKNENLPEIIQNVTSKFF
jgi:hypothetical protein